MLQEVNVKRKPPLNLRTEDENLFSGAYEASFKVYSVLTLEKVALLQDTFFSPSKLRFYATHTHVNSLGILPLGKRVVNCALKKWSKISHGIWITDEWSANYFHWMTDCLPRLWIGLEAGISDRVILPESFKGLPFVTQSLEILKINAIYYSAEENVWVEKLVLTPRTSTFPNFNEELTKLTRQKLRIQPKSGSYRKVYISRKLAPKRKVYNEDEVIQLMLTNGFEIVYAENLSLLDQITLISETKTLVSLHGAALTNMLFLPEDSSVVELRNQGDDTTQCYFNLANALGLSYYYTLNEGDSSDTIMTDFKIDLTALQEVISKIPD